jgi:hypothetical protein
VIRCAALKIQVEGLDHTTIIPCIRHGDGFKILEDLGYAPKTKYKVLEQEFLTHKNIFLNREQAYGYAFDFGQLPASLRRNSTGKLYSEDLY